MRTSLSYHLIVLIVSFKLQESMVRADISIPTPGSMEDFVLISRKPVVLSDDHSFFLLPNHSIRLTVLPVHSVSAPAYQKESELFDQLISSEAFQQFIPDISSRDMMRHVEIPQPVFQRLELEDSSFTATHLPLIIYSLIDNFNIRYEGQEATNTTPYFSTSRSIFNLIHNFILHSRNFPCMELASLPEEQVAIIHFMYTYITDRLTQSSGSAANNGSTMASNRLLIDQFIPFLLRTILNHIYDQNPAPAPWTDSLVALSSEITYRILSARQRLRYDHQQVRANFQQRVLPVLRRPGRYEMRLLPTEATELMNNDEYYVYLMKRMGCPLEDFETPLFTWQQGMAHTLDNLTRNNDPQNSHIIQKLFPLVRYCEQLRLSFDRTETHPSNTDEASANTTLSPLPSLENILALETSVTDAVNSLKRRQDRQIFLQQVESMIDHLIRFANQLLDFLQDNSRQRTRFIDSNLIDTHITNLEQALFRIQLLNQNLKQ